MNCFILTDIWAVTAEEAKGHQTCAPSVGEVLAGQEAHARVWPLPTPQAVRGTNWFIPYFKLQTEVSPTKVRCSREGVASEIRSATSPV